MDYQQEKVRKSAGNRGQGRKAGVPNKATTAAREAISLFVDGNAHKLEGWLLEVANGVWSEAEEKYVVAPNPAKAFELFQSVVEYHIPKLARTELSGPDGGAMQHQIEMVIVDPKS